MKNDTLPFINTFKHFFPLKEYFVQNRWHLSTGLLCLLIVDALQLLIPLVIKRAIDGLTLKTVNPYILLEYGLIIMIIAVLIATLRFIWRYFVFGHSRKVEQGLRNKLFQHLETLSLSFYQRTRTGDLMARSINDINAIRMAAGMGLVALMDSMVIGFAAIGFMLYINPLLTLISLIPAPIFVYLSKKLTHRMSIGYEQVQSIFSDLTERCREAFAGMKAIKAFSLESWEYERMKEGGQQYIAENMRLAKTIAFFFPIILFFTNLGMAIVIWQGGRLTILGHITTGDFVAFIGYLNLLTWPMMAIGWATNLIQRASASMRRINQILDEVPDITSPSMPWHIRSIKGKVKFERLYIQYPGKTEYALSDITLTIPKGQTVSLVGRVGSGKTTLLNTIPRLLDGIKGRIYIDDIHIRDMPLDILRKNIGFVTQETIIFSDSIKNNILFGRDKISNERLEAALKAAQLFDKVQSFEKGLDTILGERGATLSGGERQRLTIARALVSDPPILILDDSLSMVDTKTEEKILNQVLTLRKNKTNLIVSHRLATISRADLIIVLDAGKLVEVGDHRSLLAKESHFQKIYRTQLLVRELNTRVE